VKPLLFLLMLLGATRLPADSLIYGFDSFNRTGSPVAGASSSLYQFGPNGGVCNSAGNPGPTCGGFDNFGSSGTGYTFFTITPDAGKALNLISFSFDEENVTAAGPVGFDIYTSVDGYAASILGAALSQSASSFTNHSVSLSAAAYEGLTAPLTVRLSGYGGPAPPNLMGAWFVDNVTLNLTVTDVTPEPALWAPCALILAAILFSGWRRSRRA
jgi:hypothetical protein